MRVHNLTTSDNVELEDLSLNMKFASTFALFAAVTSLATVSVHAAETCQEVWAHDEELDVCAKDAGADYWGWTNGRYGMSGCAACDCPDCPTDPPTPSDPPTKAPTPDPIPLPHECSGIVGSWSGDPHFKTFDGLKFDCQGEGEFHVLRSLDSPFEVQGRFVKFKSDKRPTVTKSVVWESGDGDPKLQVTAPDTPQNGSCRPHVHVGGILTDVLQEQFIPGSTVQVQLEERKSKKFEGYVFYHHNSGLQVTILAKNSSANGCVLSAKYCLPYTWPVSKETLVGLLGGVPDGDKSNDWMDRNNNPVTVPTNKKDLKFDKSYDYCVDNWCIRTVGESMFTYETGESFDGFNECGLEADQETKACVDNPGADLSNVCGTEDLSW
ncbi:Inherit from bactNOG: hemolysin-type calcium-binding region [Seminavis robusta]|uniref:Inherit from bactNOG: hemolysin-type calcium-binding region n=1 Tax=Seminavis robusta TaxID=568900 RepID=A0A9N8DEL3_9STRA|nr:Inherit from bactNOG: hemolysin-type calcium-binding region [Seminavis robusta]|eukprot:Sro107_g053680.1 Inherit from bactNOG: hemolysin-type calcium-binding region (381) ;mRNA; r:1463-2870